MAEDKNKKQNDEQLNDEQLDEVNGGKWDRVNPTDETSLLERHY